MKKIFIVIFFSIAAVMASVSASATGAIGIVDMQKIFSSSTEAQAINASLKRQFSARKAKIMKMGNELQAKVKNYQKNQSVLSKTKLAALQKTISQQSIAFRKAQEKFQSDLLAAQNKKMSAFLDKVKSAVQKVAQKKDLNLVLPSNAVLYSQNQLNVTTGVLSALN